MPEKFCGDFSGDILQTTGNGLVAPVQKLESLNPVFHPSKEKQLGLLFMVQVFVCNFWNAMRLQEANKKPKTVNSQI